MNVNVDENSIMVTWLEPEEAGRAFDTLCMRWRSEFGDVYMNITGGAHDRRSRVSPNWIKATLTK